MIFVRYSPATEGFYIDEQSYYLDLYGTRCRNQAVINMETKVYRQAEPIKCENIPENTYIFIIPKHN